MEYIKGQLFMPQTQPSNGHFPGSTELEIARALNKTGVYEHEFDERKLRPIISGLSSFIIAGFLGRIADGLGPMPFEHYTFVRSLDIGSRCLRTDVVSTLHKPVEAVFGVAYVYLSRRNESGLVLDETSFSFKQHANWLTAAALSPLHVRTYVHDQLEKPDQLIRDSLVSPLKFHGFGGRIESVDLSLTETKKLSVKIRCAEEAR